MWPEILPGFAVMVGSLVVSGLAIGLIDRLETGGKVRPCTCGFPELLRL